MAAQSQMATLNDPTLAICVTLLGSVLILTVGTWLYLRRRKFSPRERILLFLLMFVILAVSGPAIVWTWHRGNGFVLGQFTRLWLAGVIVIGLQFLMFWRNKGEL
jgi:O-antigen/teichoic acid export membrane protein